MPASYTKKIEAFKGKLARLDEYAKALGPEQRREYRSARNRFVARLNAWEKSFTADFAIFKNNLEDGYHELEANLLSRTK